MSPASDATPGPPVAVVAHARKTLGGGLPELREVLAQEGVTDPIWYEVNKSRKAPKRARRALKEGAGLIFVWGGDGMVQRCVDELAGTDAVLAVLPAGTANLLATNLGIPDQLAKAVRVGLHGERRRLDTGLVSGEHFAVMAGAGLDARMIAGAKRKLKNRLGRAAYLYTGARSLGASPATAEVEVDGRPFFTGPASLVLAGNVGRVLGGIEAFSEAEPDDGLLDLGVVTAANPVEWVRALGQVALGDAGESPFVQLTRGKQFEIKFDREQPYELDGGARHAVTELSIEVCPASISVCVPAAGGAG
ncbi:MAG: diacylglycerol/lipid kinase family protein [Streptosporangiaceae bacterium]